MKAMARQVEHPRAAGEVEARPPGRLGHQRMDCIGRAQHRLHLAQAVVRVDLVHLQQRQNGAPLVCQRHFAGSSSKGVSRHGHRQRDRKERAVAQTHLAQHRLKVVRAHEPVERRESAHRQHLQVVLRPQRQRDVRKPDGAFAQGPPLVFVGDYQIHEVAAERGYQLARLRWATALVGHI